MGQGRSQEVESNPKRLVITEESIFLGSDGIALTLFGSNVHKLIILSNNLKSIQSQNGDTEPSRMVTQDRRISLEEEISTLCFNLGIEQAEQVVDEIAQVFNVVCVSRMPKTKDLFKQANGSD